MELTIGIINNDRAMKNDIHIGDQIRKKIPRTASRERFMRLANSVMVRPCSWNSSKKKH